jgi:hypothetical protein
MNRPAKVARLFVISLLIIGVEWTTRATAAPAPQTASSVDAVPLPSVTLTPQDSHARIVVRVHNYAHIDAGTLLGAEAVATSILSQAKTKTIWVYCPLSKEEEDRYPICPSNWGTNAFVLNILTPEMAARIKTPIEVLGSAPSPCDEDATSCPISVMYLRVERRAEQFSIQPERLLGHVLAHEVGHMLGANHASKGIMRGKWGRDDLKLMGFSILEFSTDQAKQLRAALLLRATRQERAQNTRLSASR